MLRFIKRLFQPNSAVETVTAPEEDYKGFAIKALPYQEAGQWQMCGTISQVVDGSLREHRFVRADRFPSREEAVAFTFAKARQIIDLNSKGLFG